ncbi:MAG: acyl-CoA reductase [Spirochaetales bacterium]|nr:acyl-CoA reductase [Spirochaetales bacterium]
MCAKELSSWYCGKEDNIELQGLSKHLEEMKQDIQTLSVPEIMDVLDNFSAGLLDRSNPLLKKYPASGLPFIASWCRSENMKVLLDKCFGNRDMLDSFASNGSGARTQSRAFPKGTIVHWVAGNVPTLGMLSLISGLLTKNANLIRIPSKSDDLLIDLMGELHKQGENGQKVAKAVRIVRYDYTDTETAEAISEAADVRISWGGNESTAAIKQLACKTTCTDLAFPDRTSFAVVGKTGMGSTESMQKAARLIAHDASVFEQKACASPHTVFLSTDDPSIVNTFCELLSAEMAQRLKTIVKQPPSEKEVMAILNLRAQYDMFHDAFYSEGSEFSIFTDDKEQLGPSIGNRTLFVRQLPAVEKLTRMIPENIQSVGMMASGDELQTLSEALGQAGVHRIVPLGAMTHFEVPWDGLLIPQYMVRWTTLNSN